MKIIGLQPGLEHFAGVRLGEEIDCATFVAPSSRTLLHGTPLPPDVIGSHIRPNLTRFIYKGREIIHGDEPTVSMSATPGFPAVRSLLHSNHPDLRQAPPPLFLTRRSNALSEAYFFAVGAAIRHVKNSHGYMYGVNDPPASAYPYLERAEIDEWRVPENVLWSWVGKVTVHDFPGNLLVIDADHQEIDDYFGAFEASAKHPLALAQRLNTCVMPFAEWSQPRL